MPALPLHIKLGEQRLLALFLLLVLSSSAPVTGADELLSEDEAIRQLYPAAQSVVTNWAVLQPEQVAEIEKATGLSKLSASFKYRSVVDATGGTHHATVLLEKGKHGTITFMVFVSPTLRVDQLVVLAMKEVRGRPIAESSFTRQFAGKGLADPIRVDYDIEGITGATISSTAATIATRQALMYFSAVLGATGTTPAGEDGGEADEQGGEPNGTEGRAATEP